MNSYLTFTKELSPSLHKVQHEVEEALKENSNLSESELEHLADILIEATNDNYCLSKRQLFYRRSKETSLNLREE